MNTLDIAAQAGSLNHSGRRTKTLACLLVMVIFGPLGSVLLSSGMRRVGPATHWVPADLLHILVRVLSSGWIWLGIASLITFFVANMLLLTWADYSFVLPASSAAYGVNALLGHFVLGETVSALRWFGIAVICAGVAIVGHTPHRTTDGDQ